MNRLVRKPCRVGHGLLNIRGLEFRICLNDLSRAHAVGDEVDYQGNRQPHAADAGPPPHHPRIEGDAVEADGGERLGSFEHGKKPPEATVAQAGCTISHQRMAPSSWIRQIGPAAILDRANPGRCNPMAWTTFARTRSLYTLAGGNPRNSLRAFVTDRRGWRLRAMTVR